MDINVNRRNFLEALAGAGGLVLLGDLDKALGQDKKVPRENLVAVSFVRALGRSIGPNGLNGGYSIRNIPEPNVEIGGLTYPILVSDGKSSFPSDGDIESNLERITNEYLPFFIEEEFKKEYGENYPRRNTSSGVKIDISEGFITSKFSAEFGKYNFKNFGLKLPSDYHEVIQKAREIFGSFSEPPNQNDVKELYEMVENSGLRVYVGDVSDKEGILRKNPKSNLYNVLISLQSVNYPVVRVPGGVSNGPVGNIKKLDLVPPKFMGFLEYSK